jgi:hypothetical protein
MPESEQLTQKAEQAAKAAEDAAARAEKAAVQPRYWLIAGLSFALVGAVLAFALRDSNASVLGVRLQPLGGVLFATGVLLIAAAAIGSMGSGSGAEASSIKSIGGLIAVVAGITAVTALAIITLTQLGDARDSIVAVTSSAFGIISAVVGAYLGIKITAETTSKASDEAKHAAVAEHVAHVASSERDAVTDKAKDFVTPSQAAAIADAKSEAGEVAARTSDPAAGGGGA